MCPQPLAFYGGARAWHDVFACDAWVTERPAIAAAIARLLFVYSHIERERSLLITWLMKSELRVVTSLVAAVESEPKVIAMLNSLVEQRLTVKDRELWARLNSLLKAARSARNVFAHSIVLDVMQTAEGRPRLPDSFIALIPQGDLSSNDAEAEEASHEIIRAYDELARADAASRPAILERVRLLREKYLRPDRRFVAMLERAGKKVPFPLGESVSVDPNPESVIVFSLADIEASTVKARLARHYLGSFAQFARMRVQYGEGPGAADQLRDWLSEDLPALPGVRRSPDPQSASPTPGR